MTRCRFNLHLSVEQCEQYYSGKAVSVFARTDEGIRLAFPALEIRKFVSSKGVQGRFEIVFDRHNKLVSMKRIA